MKAGDHIEQDIEHDTAPRADTAKEQYGDAGAAGDAAQPRVSVLPLHYLLRLTLALVVVQSVYHWLVNVVLAFTPGTNGIYDLSVYYAAALALRANPHANIYDPAVLVAAAGAHHAFLMSGTALYLYPPLLAILAIPLTLVSLTSAGHLWVICNLVMWVVGAVLLAGLLQFMLAPERAHGSGTHAARTAHSWFGGGRMVGVVAWVRRTPDVTLFAVAIAFYLAFDSATLEESVVIGQVSLLIFFLVVLAPWLERRGKPELAGAVLAVATLIKVFPIVLIGYYVLRGNWRVVRGAVIGFAVLIVGMVLYIGVPGVLATRHILTNASSSGLQYQNESLARAPFWLGILAGRELHRLATYSGYALIAVVVVVFTCGVLAYTWATRRRRGARTTGTTTLQPADLLGYSWALATMVLISPVTWEHHLAWLLPAAVFSAGYTLRALGQSWRADPPQFKFGLIVLAMLLVGYTFVAHDLPFGYDGLVPLSPGPYIAHHIPLRPFFMLQRPAGVLLIWAAAGLLFLRARLNTPTTEAAPVGAAQAHEAHLALREADPQTQQARVSGDGAVVEDPHV